MKKLNWRKSYKTTYPQKRGEIHTAYLAGIQVGNVGGRYVGGNPRPCEWGWQAFSTVEGLASSPHQGGYQTRLGATRALAAYVLRHVNGTQIACPECQCQDSLAMRDTIQSENGTFHPCYAIIHGFEDDGTVIPAGDTDTHDIPSPNWSTQTPIVNQHGYYSMICRQCGKTWYEPRAHYGEGGGAFADLDRDP